MIRKLVALCCTVAAVDGFALPARLPPPAARTLQPARICTALEMATGVVSDEPRIQVGTLSVSPMGMVCDFSVHFQCCPPIADATLIDCAFTTGDSQLAIGQGGGRQGE